MPKPKIDRVKMTQMLRAGKTQKEVADFFEVTEGAVSLAKQELNIAVVKDIALESAHRVVAESLDTVGQLRKINEYANELLDLLMGVNQGDEDSIKILEECGYKCRDPRDLTLKTMKEIRGQLRLQLEILAALYDLKTIQEFQDEVLAVISEIDPEVKNDIIRRLHERRAVRRAFKIN